MVTPKHLNIVLYVRTFSVFLNFISVVKTLKIMIPFSVILLTAQTN